MGRDNFTAKTIEILAKRVGMRCSNPDCRAPTAGPSGEDGVSNVGVAAHITAASPGGPRFDETLDAGMRGHLSNGIWLCQTHAKLIDDDEIEFPVSLLKEWKETAEHMAALEARGFAVRRAQPFAELEKKIPALIAEMRIDLQAHPLWREFILLSQGVIYNYGATPCFHYLYDTHQDLGAIMTIMQHAGAIYDAAYNNVPRYNFTEEFVAYLLETPQ